MPQPIPLTLPEPERSRGETMPESQRRRWRGSLYLVIWTLVGILFAGPFVIRQAADQKEVPWGEVASLFFGWYLWGLFFPAIWWLTRRWPFERRSWPRWLMRHLALGLVFALLYVALDLSKDAILAGGLAQEALRRAWSRLSTGIGYYLLAYFALVLVIHAVTFYGKLRERELTASRLDRQLAQANLQMLKMQLNPHFLFNTLNAISALMHRDVDAADRMITRLSDLLRMALDKDDRHRVRLASELEFLHRYLAIEQIRFRDRLQVEIDVAPDCLAARVPRLILQPLVENAIRHGIAMRSAAGRLTIRAWRHDGLLAMTVADDGPGVPANRPLRPGVGLTNTRARLEQLYGGDWTLELVNAEDGGFEVRLEIPFDTQPDQEGRKRGSAPADGAAQVA